MAKRVVVRRRAVKPREEEPVMLDPIQPDAVPDAASYLCLICDDGPFASKEGLDRHYGRHRSDKETIEKLRAQLDAEVDKEAAQTEAQREEMLRDHQPGEYIGEGMARHKVKWTRKAIEETYPMVEFMPAYSMPVQPHGVRPPYYLVANEVCRVPKIVQDIYIDSVQRTARASQDAAREIRAKHGELLVIPGGGIPGDFDEIPVGVAQ